ncbi:MAG: TolC family protein [Siphonobacter sp.]
MFHTNHRISKPLGLLVGLLACITVQAQQSLSLKDALKLTVENYGIIHAKQHYAEAAESGVRTAELEYLPNLTISAQQDYGTVNGQNGPLYGFGGYAVSSSGLPLANQSWNSGFGALYLANINWEVFTFGRIRERIKTAQNISIREHNDYQQEIFQQQVKVAAAYLNLLAARSLTKSWQKNLSRADAFSTLVKTRARNQLIPGVDSSQANAEVSNARIALTKAMDNEQEQQNRLAQLMGVPPQDFILDSLFLKQVPRVAVDTSTKRLHPVLAWYQSRVNVSESQARYLDRFKYPSVSLVGIFQMRGSGFYSNYSQDQNSYTSNYFDGITPNRANYLLGIGLTWNVSQLLKVPPQVNSQQLTTLGLQKEFEQTQKVLSAQLQLSETKLKNAFANYREVPFQLKAASDAYNQRSVLFKNGLTNLVDVTQALYALVRAETERDIAYNNVWQALLLKAAAIGDLEIFTSEF